MTQEFSATLIGTWDPGSIPSFPVSDLAAMQQAVASATRQALGVTASTVRFHIVARESHYSPSITRSLWRVDMALGGPSLLTEATGSHPSTLGLRLTVYPHVERLQVVYGPNEEPPYPGLLSNVVPALLLRALWGTGPRELAVGAAGSGTFTPESVRFTRMPYGPVADIPIAEPIGGDYRFVAHPDGGIPPAMWLASSDPGQVSAKISYCVSNPGGGEQDRWDDPLEAAPEFAPLTWPS